MCFFLDTNCRVKEEKEMVMETKLRRKILTQKFKREGEPVIERQIESVWCSLSRKNAIMCSGGTEMFCALEIAFCVIHL